MANLFEHGYALIIGVDEYQISRLDLPVRGRDVAALFDVLVHPQRCAYVPENVRLLMGREATAVNIKDAICRLQDKVKADPKATAVIYFSGHGYREIKTGDYYLLPYDIEDLSQIRAGGMKAEDLQALINDIEAERLLVMLDCGHDPSLDSVFGEPIYSELKGAAFPEVAAIKEIPLLDQDDHQLSEGTGCAYMLSSSGGELSHAQPDQKMSIFMYHLIEALTGHAVHDDDVTEVGVLDVLRWVTRRVQGTAKNMGKSQRPIMRANGSFVLAKLLGGRGLSAAGQAPDPLQDLAEIELIIAADSDVAEEDIFTDVPPVIADEAVDIGEIVEVLPMMVGVDAPPPVEMAPPVPEPIPVSVPEPIMAEDAKAVKQARRFEAAMPAEVRAGETTELLVMVPRADGPGLSKFLPITAVSGDEIEKEDVVSAEAQIEFPVPGEPVLVYLSVEATDYDYDIEEPDRTVKLYADRDGSYESFLLTPLRAASKTRVTVNLYGDEARTNKLSVIRLSVAVAEGDVNPALVLNRTLEYAVGRAPVTINVVGGDQIGGDKVGGDKVDANIIDSTVAIGDGAQARSDGGQDMTPAEVDELFSQLITTVALEAPNMAVKVLTLKENVEKGAAAEDTVMAGLIMDIGDVVPDAKAVIVTIFAHPTVAALVKNMPATTFAIGRMK